MSNLINNLARKRSKITLRKACFTWLRISYKTSRIGKFFTPPRQTLTHPYNPPLTKRHAQ